MATLYIDNVGVKCALKNYGILNKNLKLVYYKRTDRVVIYHDCISEEGDILWTYDWNKDSKIDCYTIEGFQSILENTLILMCINGCYPPQFFQYITVQYKNLFDLCALKTIQLLQRKQRNGFYSVTDDNGIKIKIEDYLCWLWDNFKWYYNNNKVDDLYDNLIERSRKNRKRKVSTTGPISSNDKKSISHTGNTKFTNEEIEYVKHLKSSNISIRNIKKSFEEKFKKKISIGKISEIGK